MPIVTLDPTITLALSVSDRKASAAWYEKMLGFTLIYHAHEAGWEEMQKKKEGVTWGLGGKAAASPGNAVPVFGVSDVTSARAALSAEGVRFDGEIETVDGMVSLTTFYDPDGNALMLAQDLTGEA